MHAAEDALDRTFMEKERGVTICPTCQRTLNQKAEHPIEQAIADYLVAKQDECSSIVEMRSRLSHFLDFIASNGHIGIACESVNRDLIAKFRKWSAAQPVTAGKGKNQKTRPRAPSTTEASVRQIKAVINHAFFAENIALPARFSPLSPREVDRTPTYRSSVAELATMFRYCIAPSPPPGRTWSEKQASNVRKQRLALLRFLQISTATWCRPDAAHDFSTRPERDQWHDDPGAMQLNPKGRPQTKKWRPTIIAPRQIVPLLQKTNGFVVPVKSVRKAFEQMLETLWLPRERETGLKLIRRSMAQLARRRMGEVNWVQGKIMLGHSQSSTSDLYALPDPANLGLALKATEEIIDEIEEFTHGAFTGE